MDVRDNIRQRRLERIRTIQNELPSELPVRSNRTGPVEAAASSPERPPMPLPIVDGPYDDPEYVWKERERQWLEAWKKGGGDDGGGFRFVPTRKQLWAKLIVCAAVYGLVVGMFRLDAPWTDEAKRLTRAALTEDMPFSAVEAWYNSTFAGAPSFIPTFGGSHKQAQKASTSAGRTFHAPAQGKLLAPFASGHPFVELQIKPDSPVVAMDAGLVLFAGNRDGMGYAVTLQHAGGYQTTYGGLRPGTWEKDQWIAAGEPVGKTAQAGSTAGSTLYFIVMKDGSYVNPADVVSFD